GATVWGVCHPRRPYLEPSTPSFVASAPDALALELGQRRRGPPVLGRRLRPGAALPGPFLRLGEPPHLAARGTAHGCRRAGAGCPAQPPAGADRRLSPCGVPATEGGGQEHGALGPAEAVHGGAG
ncbi:unnamed protein product, partial [Effrenium voratum]